MKNNIIYLVAFLLGFFLKAIVAAIFGTIFFWGLLLVVVFGIVGMTRSVTRRRRGAQS
jgi:uncharacterized membrane protein